MAQIAPTSIPGSVQDQGGWDSGHSGLREDFPLNGGGIVTSWYERFFRVKPFYEAMIFVTDCLRKIPENQVMSSQPHLDAVREEER